VVAFAAVGLFVLLVSRLWVLPWLVLVVVALLAWIPGVGPWLLARLRWRRLPLVGGLTGIAASLVLFGFTVAFAAAASTLFPLATSSPRPSSVAAPGLGSPAPSLAHATDSGAPTSMPSATAPSSAPTTVSSRAVAGTPSGGACSSDFAAHIYHPDRLVVLQPCLTVTGVVATLRREADGDVHVGLWLDPGEESLLNAKNLSDQGGNLVVEVICAGTVTQADAVSACANYLDPVAVPTLGTHISVTGPYVLDTQHGWDEIHPAEAIGAGGPAVVNPAAAPPSATPAPTEAAPVAPTATPLPATTVPPSTAGVTFTFVRTPVGRNQTATATVATTPGASCSIRVTYASGPSRAQGLAPTSADGNGVASWSWLVGSRTTFGSWPIDVSCGGATARAYFFVQ